MVSLEAQCVMELIEGVRQANPYPADIFIEPTPEAYDRFNAQLEEAGLSPDAYNGSWGRRVWASCCAKILGAVEVLVEEQEEAEDD